MPVIQHKPGSVFRASGRGGQREWAWAVLSCLWLLASCSFAERRLDSLQYPLEGYDGCNAAGCDQCTLNYHRCLCDLGPAHPATDQISCLEGTPAPGCRPGDCGGCPSDPTSCWCEGGASADCASELTPSYPPEGYEGCSGDDCNNCIEAYHECICESDNPTSEIVQLTCLGMNPPDDCIPGGDCSGCPGTTGTCICEGGSPSDCSSEPVLCDPSPTAVGGSCTDCGTCFEGCLCGVIADGSQRPESGNSDSSGGGDVVSACVSGCGDDHCTPGGDCSECNTCLGSCFCAGSDMNSCLSLCAGSDGCLSDDCGTCVSCQERCICEGGDENYCASECGGPRCTMDQGCQCNTEFDACVCQTGAASECRTSISCSEPSCDCNGDCFAECGCQGDTECFNSCVCPTTMPPAPEGGGLLPYDECMTDCMCFQYKDAYTCENQCNDPGNYECGGGGDCVGTCMCYGGDGIYCQGVCDYICGSGGGPNSFEQCLCQTGDTANCHGQYAGSVSCPDSTYGCLAQCTCEGLDSYECASSCTGFCSTLDSCVDRCLCSGNDVYSCQDQCFGCQPGVAGCTNECLCNTGSSFNQCSSGAGYTLIGQYCSSASECCSGICNDNQCDGMQCAAEGNLCSNNGECCSNFCDGTGYCMYNGADCTTDAGSCAYNGDCCSGYCAPSGYCESNSCLMDGSNCLYDTDCCSAVCSAGYCMASGPVTCAPYFDPCILSACASNCGSVVFDCAGINGCMNLWSCLVDNDCSSVNGCSQCSTMAKPYYDSGSSAPSMADSMIRCSPPAAACDGPPAMAYCDADTLCNGVRSAYGGSFGGCCIDVSPPLDYLCGLDFYGSCLALDYASGAAYDASCPSLGAEATITQTRMGGCRDGNYNCGVWAGSIGLGCVDSYWVTGIPSCSATGESCAVAADCCSANCVSTYCGP